MSWAVAVVSGGSVGLRVGVGSIPDFTSDANTMWASPSSLTDAVVGCLGVGMTPASTGEVAAGPAANGFEARACQLRHSRGVLSVPIGVGVGMRGGEP